MTISNLSIEVAGPELLPTFEDIRCAAFAPVFASFRSILGDEIYEAAQAPEDQRQEQLLAELFAAESGWELYTARFGETVVGFISLRLDSDNRVGEIGLNAVHPQHAGRGVGTAMYEFAVSRMRQAGMRVATVATGGDPSHAPARRAYQKAGFTVEIPSVWMCRKL